MSDKPKCTFCNDTKIETVVPGPCVWCEEVEPVTLGTVKRFNFTAQNFGAIGDGVTDCAFAIQHAGRYVAESEYDAALAREAALREELAERKRKHLRSCQLAIGKSQLAKDLQQRLTVAEQLLSEWRHGRGMTLKDCASLRDRTDAALNPAAEPERPIIHNDPTPNYKLGPIIDAMRD